MEVTEFEGILTGEPGSTGIFEEPGKRSEFRGSERKTKEKFAMRCRCDWAGKGGTGPKADATVASAPVHAAVFVAR